LIATVTNSNETVAEIDDNGGVNGLQQKTATILPGQQSTPTGPGGLEFDPLSTGTTVVTATIPNFITTSAGVKTVTVVTPAINIGNSFGSIAGGVRIGAFGGSLGASQHGGVTVHMTSSDPTRILLATTSTAAAAASVDIFVPNGQSGFSFYLQATDWIDGTSSAGQVVITATATGFISDSGTVNYVQPSMNLTAAAAVFVTADVPIAEGDQRNVRPMPR
jgi:hypothetical protein